MSDERDTTGSDVPGDQSGMAPPPTAPQRRRRLLNSDPTVFVLQRELSEVHLLLDNVSANPATTVAERSDVERPKMLPDDWIERICEINWPPEEDSDKAYDAALLINAKDYLNRLAHPASGSTIAFTHLVTQEDEAKRRRRRRKAEAAGDAGEESGLPGVQTRASLAQNAYPDLLAKAAKFRKWMLGMSVGLLIALAITCLLSWHVAYGNAMLAELTAAQTDYEASLARVNQAETPPDDPADGTSAPPDSTTQAATYARAAERASAAPPLPDTCSAPTGPEQRQACAELRGEHDELERVKRRLANWECWTCFGERSLSPEEVADAAPVASAWANILGSAVLPFFYGLLGAGAAIIRSLSRKIRSSRLSPRDLLLSLQQLALGAVVGACIGLFIAAPGADATGEGLLGPVTLSASAISFVAGFGVDAVFQGLEALIGRIFNLSGGTPATNRGDGVSQN